MNRLGPKSKQLVGMLLLLVLLLATWRLLHSRQATKSADAATMPVQSQEAGLTVNIPASYSSYESNQSNADPSAKNLVGNYVRSNPTAYLTIRYDTGLMAVTNLLRRGTLEHIEAEIGSLFPSKYGSSYKAIETKHTQVADRESIEHVFSYTSSSGQTLQTRLIAIPFSADVAYYLILQSAPADFTIVQPDLDGLKDSLNLTGPQPPAQSS